MSVLDNLKAANATGTARGTFPIIKNSASGKMKNLKLFGASTQAANPTPDNPQEISSVVLNSIAAYGKNFLDSNGFITKTSNGITFTPIYENGLLQYVNVNGTATAKTYYALTDNIVDVPKESLILNGCKGGSANTYSILASYRKEDGTTFTKDEHQTDADLPIDTTQKKYMITIFINSGVTVNNVKFYPMLRRASIENAYYEPYKGNIANLPEAIEMNGIEELKDYIDYERGVFVQKFKEKYLTKSDIEKFVQATNGNYIYTFRIDDAKASGKCICSHFKGIDAGDRISLAHLFRCYMEADTRLYIRDIESNSVFSNATNSLAFFENNDVCVWYELAEPIETPLSPAALLELNKLRTFDSITCVSNDAGAEMEIEYFKNSKIGQEMSDIHAGVPRFILDGTTLNIIV